MPILILGAVDAAFASDMAANDITLSVECAEKGRALSAALRGGKRLRIHLKLDTGMGRLGFRVQDETALREAAAVAQLPNLDAEELSPTSPFPTRPARRNIPPRSSRCFSPRSKGWKP